MAPTRPPQCLATPFIASLEAVTAVKDLPCIPSSQRQLDADLRNCSAPPCPMYVGPEVADWYGNSIQEGKRYRWQAEEQEDMFGSLG